MPAKKETRQTTPLVTLLKPWMSRLTVAKVKTKGRHYYSLFLNSECGEDGAEDKDTKKIHDKLKVRFILSGHVSVVLS